MKQSNLQPALAYDDELLKTLTIVDPEDGKSYTVASISGGLFGHLARLAARTLPQCDYCLQHLRGFDMRFVTDRCAVVRFLHREGALLPWLPRLMEG